MMNEPEVGGMRQEDYSKDWKTNPNPDLVDKSTVYAFSLRFTNTPVHWNAV